MKKPDPKQLVAGIARATHAVKTMHGSILMACDAMNEFSRTFRTEPDAVDEISEAAIARYRRAQSKTRDL